MDANATGRFIAKRRRQKGYTQKELAEKLRVTDKAVSRWETGKGLPDTSLLKPLADLLGVSVGELLAGKPMEEAQVKAQTDRVILEALGYSARMLQGTVHLVLFILGIALLLSPLYLASESPYWVLGIAVVGGVFLRVYTVRKGCSAKFSGKAFYFLAVTLQAAALVLELLPAGAVMVHAISPTERITQTHSYFSLVLVGNAHFTPLLTGAFTAAAMLCGIFSLARFERPVKRRNAAFICSAAALLFSLAPLVLFGPVGMTAASYTVSGVIFLSICLQAAVNRRELPP